MALALMASAIFLVAASGAPIFVALLSGAIVGLLIFGGPPLISLQQTIFGGLDIYALLAVPFFVFAGELMAASGIADRLIGLIKALFGRVPGSLGVAALGGSTLIGTICGSSAAAVAAVGRNMYPRLIEANYGRRRAAGLITSAGAIDIVIPPSIAMILYGAAAEQSIPKLFIAGIIPGLTIAILMAAFISASAWLSKLPTEERFNPSEAMNALRAAAAALSMPVFVLTGIYLGAFSPTEAGGFACTYAAFLGLFVYRSLSLGDVIAAAARAAMITSQIMIVVAAASVIAWLLTVQGVQQAITATIVHSDLSPLAFLLAVNVLLLAIGCLLDPTSSILVFAPLLVPIAISLGIDPIHFGIVMTANLAIGMFTPPFGLNIFVAQAVLNVPAKVIYRGVLPFVAIQVLALLIITLVPAISLSLVGTMS